MSIKSDLQQPGRGKEITGHDIMALERFADDIQHMIFFDVLKWECPVGDKNERARIFLTDEGYKQALESEGRGEMRIIRRARVRVGKLEIDAPELDRQIKPEPTPVFNTEHWDCECEEMYIHHNSVDHCDECGALRDESPDSRQSEVDEESHFAY